MKKSLFFALLLLLSAREAEAMDVEAYRAFKEQSEDLNTLEGQLASISLKSYFQGISETIAVLRAANHDRIELPAGLAICAPKDVPVSAQLLDIAVTQETVTNVKIYQGDHGWEKVALGTYALIGLARMFPCR